MGPGRLWLCGTFNIFDVNRGWAAAHPGALEDFLRATFEAFHYCLSHALTCVEDAAKYQAGYDVHQNLQRWRVKSGDVDSTLLAGHGVGYQEKGEWRPEYKLLLEYNLIMRRVDPNSVINATYVDAIYHGSSLIWPGPSAPGGPERTRVCDCTFAEGPTLRGAVIIAP